MGFPEFSDSCYWPCVLELLETILTESFQGT